MTMQAPDLVRFEDEIWLLWDYSAQGLFELENFGLPTPIFTSTACYRGFQCKYHVNGASLELDELDIGLLDEDVVPLNGIMPVKYAPWDPDDPTSMPHLCGEWCYDRLGLKIPFTGGLILCRNRIRGRAPDTGLASTFANINELVFSHGDLLEMLDHSEAVAKIRETPPPPMSPAAYAASRGISEEEAETFNHHRAIVSEQAAIENCFKLKYS